MPEFNYRRVNYGVDFSPLTDLRTSADAPEHLLHANELAVDVGGVCWGDGGEQRTVLDHHFFRREGQFPSAAAEVLHNAEKIYQHFAAQPGPIWLVTHRQPDFDAFCAMYLARAVLRGDIPYDGWTEFGLHPDGWQPVASGRPAIDWFQPAVAHLDARRRWPILLAAYAACVDNCRRLRCPKQRALHSILYAALTRGRNYIAESHAAEEFFDEVRDRIADDNRRLNPLFDSVLEDCPLFAAELSLLDREVAAYTRDIGRARRAMVYVQQAKQSFQTWFADVQQAALLGDDGRLRDMHLRASAPPGQEPHRQAVDGIYVRDPECMLFKEWARSDTEHASLGAGFLFTAVAYSNGRRGAWRNETEYFFALDPERAGNLHLYNVWARLQELELQTIQQPEFAVLRNQLDEINQSSIADKGKTICRRGFEGRAGARHGVYFDDPWFDGQNYRCTIIATPNRGMLIPAGTAADLSNDPVAAVVQRELEYAVFESNISIQDLRASPDVADMAPYGVVIPHAPEIPPTLPGCYRFCSVKLKQEIDVLHGDIANQIGRMLWRLLDTDHDKSVPRDFGERHLIHTANMVAVWSRRGVAIAFKPTNAMCDRVAEWKALLQQLADLSRNIQSHNSQQHDRAGHDDGDADDLLRQGAKLTQEVAVAKHALSLPDNRLLQRFFSAIGLADVLATMHDTHLETQQSNNLSLVAALQNKIEWVEVAIVAVYMIELMHVLHGLFGHAPDGAAHIKGFPWEQFFQGSLILALAFVAGSAALWFLQPYKHGSADSKRRASWFLWWMVLLPIGYLIAQTAYSVWNHAQDQRPTINTTDGSEQHTSGQGQSDHH